MPEVSIPHTIAAMLIAALGWLGGILALWWSVVGSRLGMQHAPASQRTRLLVWFVGARRPSSAVISALSG
jgi:hypothetical protein